MKSKFIIQSILFVYKYHLKLESKYHLLIVFNE